MNRITKTALLIASCVFVFTACKHNTPDAQNTPTGIQAPTGKVMNKDSFVHPAEPANLQMKDGMNVTRWPNGNVRMQGNYKDGKRTGEWQAFFENGKLNSDEFFTEGQTDGKVTVYYENGQKMYEGENKMGKLAGVWHYWDDKGKPTRTVDYSKRPATKNP